MLSQGVVLVEVKLLPGNMAPYRLDEGNNIPEFEFDFTESGYSFLEQFKDDGDNGRTPPKAADGKGNDTKNAATKASTQQKATQHKQAAAKQQVTATGAAKAHSHEQNKTTEDASSWSNVFEKIKGMF